MAEVRFGIRFPILAVTSDYLTLVRNTSLKEKTSPQNTCFSFRQPSESFYLPSSGCQQNCRSHSTTVSILF